MHSTPKPCDLLLVGGRVIDPETKLDAPRSVGIRDGVIVHIGGSEVAAKRTIDVSGLVVAPGFIDLHSHAQSITGLRLQALDGVTTALELESGTLPVAEHYAVAEEEGRPINFGFSASWAFARMRVLDGVTRTGPRDNPRYRIPDSMFVHHQDGPRWRGDSTEAETARILALVEEGVAEGAIGIGALLGYVPDSAPEEFASVVALAAELEQPVFVHARHLSPREPDSSLDAVQELIQLADTHRVHIHLCHMNSTSGQLIDEVAQVFRAAQRRGLSLTTESYPYASGSTAIGAAFLAPDQLPRNNLTPASITYLVTGERIATVERLAEIQANDPGGPCIVDILDESKPAQRELLLRALTFPDAAFASDSGQACYWGDEEGRARSEAALAADVWPLPEGLITHPRSTGCYARVLSWIVRELGALSLMEAIRRSTLVPAQIVEEVAPSMKRKGRIQLGADADISVFNPATVAPQGDYSRLRPSRGFEHVFVGGTSVVSDGELVVTALPGRAIRGSGVAVGHGG